ncbi:MAG: hypothetical protein DIU74_011095 [Pseudomonadota bacterium]|nr:MAG: hypothetical protein DIU71_13030 [Pseudomonadota bacterium]
MSSTSMPPDAASQAPAGDRRSDGARRAEDPGACAGTRSLEATDGWDAYEVWRRFIKEARERRRNPPGAG